MAQIQAQDIIDRASRRLRDYDGEIDTNNFLDALQETLEELNNEFTFSWTIRTSFLEYCDTLTRYASPSDFKGFIEAEPENRTTDMTIVSPEAFKRMEERGTSDILAADWRDRAIAWMLKARVSTKYIDIHSLNSHNSNGTIAVNASSDATNLHTDVNIFRHNSGSVAFDVDVSQSVNNYAEIAITGMNAVDLSDHENASKEIMDWYIPDITNVSSILLRWGDGSSSYWELSATIQADGRALESGWNTIALKWESATKTGSPDSSAITYALFRLVYSASQTDMKNIRLNWLRSAPIEVVPVKYASTNIAITSASNSAQIDTLTAGTNLMLFGNINNNVRNACVRGMTEKLFRDMDKSSDADKELARYVSYKKNLRELYPSRLKTFEQTMDLFIST